MEQRGETAKRVKIVFGTKYHRLENIMTRLTSSPYAWTALLVERATAIAAERVNFIFMVTVSLDEHPRATQTKPN